MFNLSSNDYYFRWNSDNIYIPLLNSNGDELLWRCIKSAVRDD
jgi:hypothetical protein